jgi:hypothetical protein
VLEERAFLLEVQKLWDADEVVLPPLLLRGTLLAGGVRDRQPQLRLALEQLGDERGLAGAAEDPRFEQVRQDVALLLRTVREQDRKIERLEREVTRLASIARGGKPPAGASQAIEAPGRWVSFSAWEKLEAGMAEAEVVAALGAPTAVRVDDAGAKTLLYTLELAGTGYLTGSVVLDTRGRVREVRNPELR